MWIFWFIMLSLDYNIYMKELMLCTLDEKKWIWYIQKSIERNNLVYILKKNTSVKLKFINLYESDNYLDFYKNKYNKNFKMF